MTDCFTLRVLDGTGQKETLNMRSNFGSHHSGDIEAWPLIGTLLIKLGRMIFSMMELGGVDSAL